MIIEKIEIKDTLEEIVSHDKQLFPYSYYYVEPQKYFGGEIPWHWHRDFEVLWVMQGTLEFWTNKGRYDIRAGEAVFINSNTMHYQKPKGNVSTITLNQVFDPGIISGSFDSVFAQKYVDPVVNCHDMDILIFKPSSARHRLIIEEIKKAYDCADLGEEGFELLVRSHLSLAWAEIYKEAVPQIDAERPVKRFAEERIKNMLEFMHENYGEKISLDSIASAAGVSKREALRTFREVLDMSPFSYLLDYRLRRAQLELLQSDKPISDIAYDCGFSTPSYFAKVYKEKYGETPKATQSSGL